MVERWLFEMMKAGVKADSISHSIALKARADAREVGRAEYFVI